MLLTRLAMHFMSRITVIPTFAKQLYTLACSANAASITTACIHSCSRAKIHTTPRFSAYTPFSVHIKITPLVLRIKQPTHKLPNTSNNKYFPSRPNYKPYTTDLQHTIADNSLHRMGKHQPVPPANILTPCLHHPINLVSFIPTQHPTMVYHTWFSKLGEGQAGIDHILIALDCIHPDSACGVDHEISNRLFKTDHRLLFATIDTHQPNTARTPLTTTRFQYRRVAQIPLKKTYPKDSRDTTPPWFVPKTIGILPTDVRSHAHMYEVLQSAHDHPKVQAHLSQMTQHLAALDSLTTSLYHRHCSTIPRPTADTLIPRTPDARRLINIACTSWKLGIEQMMRTSKLITTHKPRTGPSSSGAMFHRKYAVVTVNKNGMITPRRFLLYRRRRNHLWYNENERM